MSPILLTDNRLATCSLDCSIRILSIDFTNRTYTIDINKQNAHSSPICSICELSNNRLASSSYDHSIKIWSIDKKALSLVQTLTRHIHQVFRVISLEHNVFASCSFDRTVRLWNEVTYQELTVLQHNRSVNYLLQLKKRDILVTSCFNSCLCCWDVTKCTKVSEIHGIYTYANSHMIEVGDELVAVSVASFQDSIVIVNCDKGCVVKEIKERSFIVNASGLCLVDCGSFVYVNKGTVVQVKRNGEYEVLSKHKGMKALNGVDGVISVDNGRFFVVTGNDYGLVVVKVVYVDDNI